MTRIARKNIDQKKEPAVEVRVLGGGYRVYDGQKFINNIIQSNVAL